MKANQLIYCWHFILSFCHSTIAATTRNKPRRLILNRPQAKIIYVSVPSRKLEELTDELQCNKDVYMRWK